MTDIEIKAGDKPAALAELIASTLHGHIAPDPLSAAATLGRLVRRSQELAEQARPSRNDAETVNFAKLDDDNDWSNV